MCWFRRSVRRENEISFGNKGDLRSGTGAGQHPSGKNRDFPQCICKGEAIYSDKKVCGGLFRSVSKAGWSKYFTRETQDPSCWDYSEKVYEPVRAEEINGGVLYELETELTAVVEIRYHKGYRPLRVYCGESREEALDLVHCYYSWEPDEKTGRCPRCAVRFFYIPDCGMDEISVESHPSVCGYSGKGAV